VSSERLLHHLECPSGLAGDMFLGACLDLGMPLQVLAEAVASLGLPGVGVQSRRARRGGILGTRFRVLRDGAAIEGPDPDEATALEEPPSEDVGQASAALGGDRHRQHGAHPGHHASPDHGPGRHLAEIRDLIGRSGLSSATKDRAVAMFSRLAEVEGAIHGLSAEAVHFHEVGAIDSIVDIVGACVAVENLGGAWSCGTVVTGGGTVATAHGVLPVPSPATAALLVGIPAAGGGEGELLTPTGALILAELVGSFGPAPLMVAARHGYGLGRWDPPQRPNVVRLTSALRPGSAEHHDVAVLECEVDDLTGEGAGYAVERLLESGALDAYLTPVQMKKNRPGILLTVLCRPSQSDALARVLLEETGSLGCRRYQAARLEAERRWEDVGTPWGTVRVKVGTLDGRELAASPEFEDCRKLAREHGVPWRDVHRAALVAWAAEGTRR
jgi:uncharacterized protein (TIGR00299 family) protein